MKRTIALALFALSCALVGLAEDKKEAAKETVTPEKITPKDAEKYIGKHAVVVGKVASVKQTEKITHINFGPAYPNQDFTAVVFSSRTNQFPDLAKLAGRTVEISGHVEDYNGKPQIVLSAKTQLKVMEEADKSKDAKPKEEKPATPEPAK